jgi:hypothetical protein
MQEKAEAERKSDREEIKAMQNKADAEKEWQGRNDSKNRRQYKSHLATQLKTNETKEDMKIMQENIPENLKKTTE